MRNWILSFLAPKTCLRPFSRFRTSFFISDLWSPQWSRGYSCSTSTQKIHQTQSITVDVPMKYSWISEEWWFFSFTWGRRGILFQQFQNVLFADCIHNAENMCLVFDASSSKIPDEIVAWLVNSCNSVSRNILLFGETNNVLFRMSYAW